MASTHISWTPNTTRTLLLIAMSATTGWGALSEMTYKGCFSSSQPLKDQGPWTYQTSGYCQPICVKANQAVLALSDGSHCWCGSELPATDSQVDDSKCNDPCNGYDSEMCGGDGYYSVYLTGTEDNVSSYGGSGGSSHAQPDSDSSSAASTPTTTRPPTVVTSVSPGRTIVITKPAEPVSSKSSTPTPESDTSGGSTNVAGIAAGVVVGVVAAVAIVTALFFWLRHRRRTAAEDEYKRTQVADFMRGGERKPPPTGYSTTSDSRLDPEAGNRRDSHGSIADDQDFSRRILRVANPDK